MHKPYAVTAQENIFKAVKTFVQLGKSSNNQTEILEGVCGDRLVEDGIRLVEDQQLVKIIQS